MKNREATHPGGANTSRLVWLLASCGLGLGIVMLAISGVTLSRISAKRRDLNAFQVQVATLTTRFDHHLTGGYDVFVALLTDVDRQQESLIWIDGLEGLVHRTQELAGRVNIDLELTPIREQCDPLQSLNDKCVAWQCADAQLTSDLTASSERVTHVLRRLRQAVEKTEGRLRLQLAVKTRRLDQAPEPAAGELAREVVKEMILPSSLAAAKTELADLALVCEQLSQEEHIDHLADAKDNRLKSILERLRRSLSQLESAEQTGPQSAIALLGELAAELFGAGFVLDQVHQTIVPEERSFFALAHARLVREEQRGDLLAEIVSRIQQLRVACHQMNTDIHASTAELTAVTHRSFARAWRVMLLLCLIASAAFVSLASRIARAVNGQVAAIRVAKGRLDQKMHALAELNQSLCSEISERKRVETRLKQERDFSESLIASLPGVFYLLDEQGRMAKVNAAFLKTVGYSREEALAKNALDYFPEEDKALAATTIQEVFAEGQSTVEAHLLSSNGMATPYFLTGVRVSLGDTSYLVGVGLDMTDRRAAERQQARLLEELSQVNEQLQDFAYVVSHDLKAPLRGIKVLTEWLCTDYGDQLGGDAQENLQLLQSRVDRMHNLIEGVLQYSRIGRIEGDPGQVDVNEALGSIVDAIAPPEHIEIVVDGTLPTIEGEPTRIGQVFQNLLSNAVKYMDKPAGRIVVACRDDGDAWTFSVSDNGPGIEQKHFERVFKIFQTLASRDEYESTGVGLTLVRRIVELYGGRIWVESKLGQGCTFCFTWPKPGARTDDEPMLTSAGAIQ